MNLRNFLVSMLLKFVTDKGKEFVSHNIQQLTELGIVLEDNMPKHEYLEYFYPEYKIHMPVSNMENVNTPEYLNSILEQIDNHLKYINISTPDYELNKGYIDPSPVKDFNQKDNEQEYIDNHPDEKFNEHTTTNPVKNVGAFDDDDNK